MKSVVMLTVLSRFGGVFVDSNYFLLEELTWLQQISANKHVFNKWSDVPSVFMFHNHTEFEWFRNIYSPQVK